MVTSSPCCILSWMVIKFPSSVKLLLTSKYLLAGNLVEASFISLFHYMTDFQISDITGSRFDAGKMRGGGVKLTNDQKDE